MRGGNIREKSFTITTGAGRVRLTGGIDATGSIYILDGVWENGPYENQELSDDEIVELEERQKGLLAEFKRAK